jgi:predicted  nucleic acid-binding Zn-ribbon protein
MIMQKPDYMLTMSDLQRSNDTLRANIIELHLERKKLKADISKVKKEVDSLLKMLKSEASKMAVEKPKAPTDNYTWTKEDFEKAKNDPTLRRELEEAFYSSLLGKKGDGAGK